MGNKRNRKKSDRKHDDDANRKKQKLRNRAKRERVVETKKRIEDIRRDLHDIVDEMEIENRVQEEQMEVEDTIIQDVNSDLHVNVDEVNIEDQNQDPKNWTWYVYIMYFSNSFLIINCIFGHMLN